MSRTINTMPAEVQRKAKGGHRFVYGWPHDMSWNTGPIQETRVRENRRQRGYNKQAIREGRYDDVIPFKKNAKWLCF